MAFELPGIFGSKEKPELDKFEKALGDLKEQLETKTDDVFDKLKKAFLEDLNELKITNKAQQEALWEKAKKAIEGKLLDETPEAKELSAFVDDIENYPIIKEATESQKPLAKVKGKLKEYGMLTVAIFGLEAWCKEALKKDPDSWMAKGLTKILDYFKKEEGEKETEEKATPPEQTTKAPEAKTIEELNQKLANLGWTIEAVTVDDVKANHELANQVETALTDGSKLKILIEAMKATGNTLKDFTLKVADLALNETQLSQITAVVKGDSVMHQVETLDPTHLREFVDALAATQGDNSKLDNKYKKQTT